MLSPGIAFILSTLPRLLLPTFAVFMLLLWCPVKPSPPFRWFMCLFATPVLATVLNMQSTYLHRRNARRLGAVLIPRMKGKWPGNVDFIFRLFHASKHGYLADAWHEIIEESAEGGDTLNTRFLWGDQIITSNPEHFKSILATSFDNFEKGPMATHAMRGLLGNGIFNTDGELWKFHRSITRPFFVKERITDFETFRRHADKAIDLLKDVCSSGSAVDVQDMAGRFTLDSATEFLFGRCVDSLSAPLPSPANAVASGPINHRDTINQFAQALNTAQVETDIRNLMLSVWPLREITKDRVKESTGFLRSYIEPIMREALTKKGLSKETHSKADQMSGTTFLDHLVDVTDNEAIIIDELINILIAGRDTTASTITSVIYLFAMHPDVMDRLRKEVISYVGRVNPPTYDNLRDMKYLRAVINETLRLFPPVPVNRRSSIGETTWTGPNGTKLYVPPGTTVTYSVFVAHRREDLWGPDSHVFDPDRWLDQRLKDYVLGNPYIFMPFNAGPRICVGQQFAYNELSFFLVRLLQSFDAAELVPEAFPPEVRPPAEWRHGHGRKAIEQFWPRCHLTLYSDGGMWVRLRVAADDDELSD